MTRVFIGDAPPINERLRGSFDIPNFKLLAAMRKGEAKALEKMKTM
jgi:hypothetical protein